MRAIKLIKKTLQGFCGIAYLIGTLQACSSIDFDTPVVNAFITFLISGIFFLLSLVAQRYEDWKRAENRRIANNLRKYHDASRLAGMQS